MSMCPFFGWCTNFIQISHPSCTFCNVDFLLQFLWEVSFIQVCSDLKGNNLRNFYASFQLALVHQNVLKSYFKIVQKCSWKNQLIEVSNQKIFKKSIYFEYYISTHHNKFHLHIVNIFLVIEFQNNIEF